MISVQSLINSCLQELDATGSSYYTFNEDFKEAINSALDFLTYIIASDYDRKKFSDDILQDLICVKIFQTSNYSRVRFEESALGYSVWSILSVDPNPITDPVFFQVPSLNANDSFYRHDLIYVNPSGRYANRLVAEDRSKNLNNPFVSGHTPEAGETVTDYAYVPQMDYRGTNYQFPNQDVTEIQISPDFKRSCVAITHTRVPKKITTIGDSIEFPLSVQDIIKWKTISNISIKQGDGTTAYATAEKNLSVLIGSVS